MSSKNENQDMESILSVPLPKSSSLQVPLKEKKDKNNGKPDFVPNPKFGVFLTLINVGLNGINQLVLKYIYIQEPNMNPIKLLYFRALIAASVTILYVNKDLKLAMYDSIEKSQVKFVIMRII